MGRVEIISASAGTGKTTRLARLIHEAVGDGAARPEAILATTFTNRAAAELAERAREKLLEGGEATAAHRLHAARVGTVNSVCGRIVHDFAFHHGVSPRVSVLDERRAEEEPLRAPEALPRELLNELEDLNKRMGIFGGPPGAFAGPSEWDWWQDVIRVVNLARSNAIGIERFSEFAERSTRGVLGFLDAPAPDGEALDRALEAALKKFLAGLDLEADTTKTTRDAQRRARSAFARGPRSLSWSDWASLAQLTPARKSLALADPVREAAAAHDRHPRLRDDLARAVKAVFDAAAYVLEAYAEHKRGLGVIDFIDQETEALALLRDEAVRAQLAGEIDLVLVDEFQDTNPIQLAIFLELARLAPRSVWVGDPKQAIYGFRGADPSLMDAAVAALLEGAAPETLDHSYRSRPAFVRLTSELFAPAFAETGIPEALVRVEPGLPAEPEGLGPILERWVLEPGVDAETGKAKKNAELDLVSLAAGVESLLGDPATRVRDPESGEVRKLQPGDVAVLCFRNDQCTGLARELEARGVRAVVGRPGLASTLEAQLAIAALRLWIDPRDSLARAQLARWLDHDEDGDAWLEAVLAARGSDALFSELAPVVAVQAAREPRTFAGVLAAFDAALAAVGVREHAVTFGDATARLANLDALRAVAASYVEQCRSNGTPCSLRGLLTHLEELASELRDTQAAAERPDAVRIVTLHGAKGLEWPVTVLADLTDRPDVNALGVRLVSERDGIDLEAPLAGRWIRYWPGPYGRKRKDVPFLDRVDADEASDAARNAARREALRLVYVGWTRARDRLVYAGRPGRIDDGGLVVLAAGGAALLSEPGKDGRACWGLPGSEHELEILVRRLPPERRDGRDRRAALGYAPAGPQPHPPAFVRPSELVGEAAVGDPIEIGERIPVAARDDDDMRRFGDALHAFFAADRASSPPTEREALAREILERFAVAGVVPAAKLPVAADALGHWIASRWPGAAVRREWPVLHRLPEGSVLRGTADLVLELDAGLVVIDHKSFPGNRAQATARAAEHAGQLAAYARALAASTGRGILGSYIHLPVSGLAIEVGIPG